MIERIYVFALAIVFAVVTAAPGIALAAPKSSPGVAATSPAPTDPAKPVKKKRGPKKPVPTGALN